MADFRNCKRCGKLYTYIGGAPLCSECKNKDEEDFRRVKNYLYSNPSSSMTDVSLSLDISVEKITRYLREGRLEIVGDTNFVLGCESCGKSIKTGRYCEECQSKLKNDMNSAFKDMSKNSEQSQQQPNKAGKGLLYLNKNDTKKK